jgi:alkanesulfonate monooxygenase SsuD/methylene tetrahydromethanopterin reductase-like flavin-dependent oxidoreductase (luciferase family)
MRRRPVAGLGLAAHVGEVLTVAAVGPPARVAECLDQSRERTGADELIATHQATSVEARLRSVRLLAEAMSPVLT